MDGDEVRYQKVRSGWHATKRGGRVVAERSRERFDDFVTRRADDRFRDAVRHARPLVYAEALAFFVVVLTLDDLKVLRVPAFLVAVFGMVAILAFAGLLHGGRLASRLYGLDARVQDERLVRARTVGRVSLFVVSVCALAWLVVFSAGVPSWAA